MDAPIAGLHLVRGHAALRRGRASRPGHAYHLTFTVRGRAPVFAAPAPALAAAGCLDDPATVPDVDLLAWVLMPDHAHCLLVLGNRETLPVVASRLKAATARAANAVLGREGPLWCPAYHDHAIRTDEDLRNVARYIIANPVRAGLVARAADYPYWNAIWADRAHRRPPTP